MSKYILKESPLRDTNLCIGGPLDKKIYMPPLTKEGNIPESFYLYKYQAINQKIECIRYVRYRFDFPEGPISVWGVADLTKQQVFTRVLRDYLYQDELLRDAVQALEFYRDNAIQDSYVAAKVLHKIRNGRCEVPE